MSSEAWPWIDRVWRRGMSGRDYAIDVVPLEVANKKITSLTAALKDAEQANVLLRDQLDKEMAQTEAVERELEAAKEQRATYSNG